MWWENWNGATKIHSPGENIYPFMRGEPSWCKLNAGKPYFKQSNMKNILVLVLFLVQYRVEAINTAITLCWYSKCYRYKIVRRIARTKYRFFITMCLDILEVVSDTIHNYDDLLPQPDHPISATHGFNIECTVYLVVWCSECFWSASVSFIYIKD